MSFRRAVVIGSSGQVARALENSLRGRELIKTSSKGGEGTIALDLASPASIRAAFAKIAERFGRGDVEVFLCGALTHVDRCEQEPSLCVKINQEGPALVAQESRALGYGLTYFSTEYVFGGAEYEGGAIGPFDEKAPPFPTCAYGVAKLEAERAVQAIFADDALIVRTTMIFSWDNQGMNFLMQYLRQLDAAKEGKAPTFRVPMDQISTPTYAPALAEATVALRDRGLGGIYNLAGSDLVSRKELVEKVAEVFGYGRDLAAKAFSFTTTAELGQAAKRPLTAGLSVRKAVAAGVRIDSLEQALKAARSLRPTA